MLRVGWQFVELFWAFVGGVGAEGPVSAVKVMLVEIYHEFGGWVF